MLEMYFFIFARCEPLTKHEMFIQTNMFSHEKVFVLTLLCIGDHYIFLSFPCILCLANAFQLSIYVILVKLPHGHILPLIFHSNVLIPYLIKDTVNHVCICKSVYHFEYCIFDRLFQSETHKRLHYRSWKLVLVCYFQGEVVSSSQ